MVTCTVCGAENEAGALFCGTCGSALTAPGPAATSGAGGDDGDVVVPGTGSTKVGGTGGGDTGTSAGGGGTGVGQGGGPGTGGTGGGDSGAGQGSGGAGGIGTGGGTGTDGGTGSGVGPDTGTIVETPTIVCQVCGTVNDASRVYCRKCANELHPAAPKPVIVTPKPNGTKIHPLFLVGIGLAVIAVIAIGAVLLVGGPKASGTPTANATTPPPNPTTPGTPAGTEPPATESPFAEGDTPPGRIVYTGGKTGDYEIFVVNADGSGSPVEVTSDGRNARDGDVSKDGSVVYVSKDGLRIVSVDGGNPEPFSKVAVDVSPYFAPDGSYVVFASKRTGDNARRIYKKATGLSDPTNTAPTALTENDGVDDHDPVITPDGSKIIWAHGADDATDIWIMDADGSNPKPLTSNDFNDVDPAIAPDGKTLLFASNRGGGFDLWTMDIDVGDASSTLILDRDNDVHDPSWSPGGRYFVYHIVVKGQADLEIFDRGTGQFRTLLDSSDGELWATWH